MQTTIPIDGNPIRLDVFEPHSDGPHPAILLVHGSGGNTDFWLNQITPPIARAGVAVFAVHYFDRTGTTRAGLPEITDGIHVPLWLSTIQQTVAHIARLPSIDPERIGLVGISLGAFLALALPTLPDTLSIKTIVEISGGLVPPYADNATHDFPPTLILHGSNDSVVTVEHAYRLEEELDELQVPHMMQIFRGEGHWFTEHAQQCILTDVAAFLGSYL
jgi:carboxymethylenebutenolidase